MTSLPNTVEGTEATPVGREGDESSVREKQRGSLHSFQESVERSPSRAGRLNGEARISKCFPYPERKNKTSLSSEDKLNGFC